jgi:hypothetical protein
MSRQESELEMARRHLRKAKATQHRLSVLQGTMSHRQEHQSGDQAPRTGHYAELNIFGTRTGKLVHRPEREELRPGLRPAPSGCTITAA